MPQAIAGYAVLGSAAATFGTAVAVGIGTAIAYAAVYVIVSAAVAYAFAAITKALTTSGRDLANEAASRQTVVRSAAEPRRLLYGVVKVAGPLVFATTTGVDNAFLHMVIAIAGSEITAVDEIWFDDIQLPAGAGTGDVTIGKFAGVTRVLAHLGQAGQTVDTFLQTDVGTGLWDSLHVLSNTAYLYVRVKWNQTIFPSGIPRVSAVVRGRKIYDPRSTLTAYSTNSALVVRDYLTHPNGLNCSSTDIDDVTFAAAANICDEAVTIAPSGAQVRYDANGSIPLDMPRKTAVDQMLTSCAGYLVYSQGVYKMYAGAYRTPTVTLTEDNMSGPISVSPRIPRAELFNAVRGQFVNPNASWQAVDFPPIKNATYQTEDGGEQIFADLALPFTTNAARAQRIAKIMLEKSRQPISVVYQGNLTCFRVQPLDTVMLTIEKLGWTAKTFLCVGWTLAETGQVILTFQEEAASVYTWAGGSETLIDTAPATNLPDPLTVAAPTSFVVASSNEFLLGGSGQVTSRLKLTWVPPVDIYVNDSGRIEIQYRKDPSLNWIVAPSAPGDATTTYLGPVSPGASYDVQIRAVNSYEIDSAWVQANNHIVVEPTFSDNSDNLIPNPNSEVGAPASTLVPDGVGLLNDASNAFSGQWVRRFTATASVQRAVFSAKLASTAGDKHYFEAQIKGTTAHVSPVNLTLQYFDATGALSLETSTAYTPTTTYARIGVVGTAPVASTAVRAALLYGSAGDTGKNVYVDNMYMRRMVNGVIIQDDSVSDVHLTNGYNNDNMIPNANSELGLAAVGLFPEGNKLVNDAVNAFAGSWCRAITIPAASFATIGLTSAINVSPGESFLFEAYAKASSALVTSGVYAVMVFTDANDANPVSVTSNSPLVGTTYQKLSVTTTVPTGKVILRCSIESSNTANPNTGKIIYADSFLLKRMLVSGQDSNVFSDNLIINGSFERGNQDYETTLTSTKANYTFLSQPGDAPEGNYCLRMNAPFAAFGAGAGYLATLRAFPTTPGATYNVRCRIRHQNGTGTNYIRMLEAASQPSTGFIGDGVISPYTSLLGTFTDFHSAVSNAAYTTWTQLEFVYTPVSTTKWASFAVYNYGASTGYLDIDEVEVRRQIGTEHMLDNAVTEPVYLYSNTAISALYPFVSGMLGYPVPTMLESSITSGVATQVRVEASASIALTSGSTFPAYVIANSLRLRTAINIATCTLNANTSNGVAIGDQTWTIVTTLPHGMIMDGELCPLLYGTGFSGLNSTVSVNLRHAALFSVPNATTFTFPSSGILSGAPGAVASGGYMRRRTSVGAGTQSQFKLLQVPPNTSITAIGSTSFTDTLPSSGTWTYLIGMESGQATTANAADRSMTLLGLKK